MPISAPTDISASRCRPRCPASSRIFSIRSRPGADKAEFDKTARALVGMFQKNFAKFEAQVDADVRAAAPEVKLAAEQDFDGSCNQFVVERNYGYTKEIGSRRSDSDTSAMAVIQPPLRPL
jgi:hypothetical protein